MREVIKFSTGVFLMVSSRGQAGRNRLRISKFSESILEVLLLSDETSSAKFMDRLSFAAEPEY
jgi:hypothetical protein